MQSHDEPEDLRVRTKRFALRIIRLYQALPITTEAQIIGKQVLRLVHRWERSIVRDFEQNPKQIL